MSDVDRNAALPVVMFEETYEERRVTGWCQRCGTTPDDFPMVVISPSGLAHLQADDGYENTVCGQNGAREGWWWKT